MPNVTMLTDVMLSVLNIKLNVNRLNVTLLTDIITCVAI
jgi:hypothetical protein